MTSGSVPTSATVDSSLWWDSFAPLLNELENASPHLDPTSNLAKKLITNHAWFLDLLTLFKPPNQKSRAALNSQQVNIGSNRLTILPRLRDAAMQISSSLCLDEIQSYIILFRFVEQNNVEDDFPEQEYLHVILLQYYIERQCLLKCTRQILMHAFYDGVGSKESGAIREVVLKLVSDGMESKLLSVIQNLLLSSHLEEMDVGIFALWSEEILIEENLLLDILFLAYHGSFCTCCTEQWKKLWSLYHGIICGSLDFGKLAVTDEAIESSCLFKAQLLLIIMETLKLENLLQMLHDELPLRQGLLVYSMEDILEMDAIISSFNAFEMNEAGPLILTWAVFLCLIASLPGNQENNVLMEIDHVGYVRQAFEAASLNYFLETLQSNILNNLDGPVTLYRSVVRTFVSAFIASYEIKFELADTSLKLILDIICNIFRGEESLCIQFWDRDSFIDRPIRCLLSYLESEFPFRFLELIRFLAALCEGSWPAECVYHFLDKSVGMSSLFEIGDDKSVDDGSHVVETHSPLHVPGVEGLIIPSKTRGHVLKIIEGNIALVRWEHTESGVFVLLLRMAQELHLHSDEEILIMLDLLCRLVLFNTAICFNLINLGNSFCGNMTRSNGPLIKNVWFDTAEIVCMLIRNLLQNSCSRTFMLSMTISILAKMLRCSPSHVAAVALKANIFEVCLEKSMNDVGFNFSSRFAKLLILDCEQNNNWCPLVISVLEFAIQLLETGIENDAVLSLVLFCFQFVFVDHEHWKYKAKHVRWNVTFKVLELMKKCLVSNICSQKHVEVLCDILLSDSSIHNTLFRIICKTPEALEKFYVSRLYDSKEIEGLLLAICSALDVIYSMLSCLKVDSSSSLPIFYHAVFSSTTKPIPVVTAVVSFVSYSQNPVIQVSAARLLSILLMLAGYTQQYLFSSACFSGNDGQIKAFRNYINDIFCEHSLLDEDRFIVSVKLLTSAARYQPAFLVSVLAPVNHTPAAPSNDSGLKPQGVPNLLHALHHHVEKSGDLIKSNPRVLLIILDLLKALWQGVAQYKDILLVLRNSEKFWKQLSNVIMVTAFQEVPMLTNLGEKECLDRAYRYQCQSVILEILSYEMFLRKRTSVEEPASFSERQGIVAGTEKSESNNLVDLVGILSSWCDDSVLGDLLKSLASCEYDNNVDFRSKVAAVAFMVHVMGKLLAGDEGCLSLLLIDKIRIIFKELIKFPSFTELVALYSRSGSSVGEALNASILDDLFHHLGGELEDRKIDSGPFKELSNFLLDSEFLQSYRQKYNEDAFLVSEDVAVFTLSRLRADLGFDMWEDSGWIADRAVGDNLLRHMQCSNSMVIVSSSKLFALKALMNFLTIFNEDLSKKDASSGAKISKNLTPQCISHVCLCFHAAMESFVPSLDASKELLDFLAAQAGLLLHLVRLTHTGLSLQTCTILLQASGSGLKILSGSKLLVSRGKVAFKVLLSLILCSIESCPSMPINVEFRGEVSTAILGLLPVLCKCVEVSCHWSLSLSCTDRIIKNFLAPSTWFPILQKHLSFQLIISRLQDKKAIPSFPVILKFLLTLVRVREGAEMLLNLGLFQSLKVMFTDSSESDDKSGEIKRPLQIWELGLAVVTALIHSLGGSFNTLISENMVPYFFSEKGLLISYFLVAPDFPSDDPERKRPKALRVQIPLAVLRETEQTLMLICALVKRPGLWVKAMEVMDSRWRERGIYLLAFISRGNHGHGELPSRTAPLLCHPVSMEEMGLCTKPSFVESGRGWFALCPLGCGVSKKDRRGRDGNLESRTFFSDTVAVQVYRIAFFLLKFLCLQAEATVRRAEDVGFVDLARFPELPVPEILHGLQDQSVGILVDLCGTDKPMVIRDDSQSLCLMLFEIMEMALYLELCVSHICELRPVMGRVEDFTKELKVLFRVAGKHEFLKGAMDSLRLILPHIYPGLSDGRWMLPQ